MITAASKWAITKRNVQFCIRWCKSLKELFHKWVQNISGVVLMNIILYINSCRYDSRAYWKLYLHFIYTVLMLLLLWLLANKNFDLAFKMFVFSRFYKIKFEISEPKFSSNHQPYHNYIRIHIKLSRIDNTKAKVNLTLWIFNFLLLWSSWSSSISWYDSSKLSTFSWCINKISGRKANLFFVYRGAKVTCGPHVF